MEKSNRWKIMAKCVASWGRSTGIFFGALLFSASAAARIGETEAEVQTRYGNPAFILPSTVENSLTKCYLSEGLSIAVTYMKGRSVRETFAKADRSKLTEKEIQRLLKRNAGGATWNAQELAGQKNVPQGLLGWRTDDEQPRVALYDERTQAFFVTTQRFINQTNAANQRNAARMNRRSIAGREEQYLLRSSQFGSPVLGGQNLPASGPTPKGAPSK
jgi:hypothetical protein